MLTNHQSDRERSLSLLHFEKSTVDDKIRCIDYLKIFKNSVQQFFCKDI